MFNQCFYQITKMAARVRNKHSMSITCYFLLLYTTLCISYADEEKKVYIVYMGSLPEDDDYSPSSHHLSMLGKVLMGSAPEESLVRSYGKSFNGFVAKLSDQEKEALSDLDEVVSVFPSKEIKTHTTRSWDFSGFPINVNRQKKKAAGESEIIVGVVDSGIWPESKSFSDQGFGPVPTKWKGQCEGGENFTCNKKIIGARFYHSDGTARDLTGHGSHVASTVAGNIVKDANLDGLAGGVARGGVPSARIAVYKTTGLKPGGTEDAVLAAFDDGIKDGVDLFQVSLGPFEINSFDTDALSIGAFHAFVKGILTVQAAGNEGGEILPATVLSGAPWILTVGATTTDRKFMAKLIVDKNKETSFTVNAINIFGTGEKEVPLVHGKSVGSSSCNDTKAGLCLQDCLDPKLAKDKILVCDSLVGIREAFRVGALGIIAPISATQAYAPHVLPMPYIQLNQDDYAKLVSYLQTSKSSPQGKITRSETVNDSSAPVVAALSSRGPNPVAFDIMKPDISAPGISILAAYSPDSHTAYIHDAKYYIKSGTSMACPHVSGAAAYVKSFHPTWSPSAIKSALMTTARHMNYSKDLDAEFAYGSGYFDPIKAIDPGLIYDTTVQDHITFLCKLGYTVKKIKLIGGSSITSCPGNSTNNQGSSPQDINYPSLTVQVKDNKPFKMQFTRTVTNVGDPKSTYTATIDGGIPDSRLQVHVNPTVLNFNSLNQKMSFDVTVDSKKGLKKGSVISNQLIWKSSDGHHLVRSPIVVYNYPDSYTYHLK